MKRIMKLNIYPTFIYYNVSFNFAFTGEAVKFSFIGVSSDIYRPISLSKSFSEFCHTLIYMVKYKNVSNMINHTPLWRAGHSDTTKNYPQMFRDFCPALSSLGVFRTILTPCSNSFGNCTIVTKNNYHYNNNGGDIC